MTDEPSQTTHAFVELAPHHLDLLGKLLSADFPGAAQLREQLSTMRVREFVDKGDPVWRFQVSGDGQAAKVAARVPVEAVAIDRDGARVRLLVHVLTGHLWEVEFFREDGAEVLATPSGNQIVEIITPTSSI